MIELATCKMCKEELPLDDEFFYRSQGKLWPHRCKACMKKYVKQWRQARKAQKSLVERQQLMARKDVQEVAEFARQRGIRVRFEVK